MSLEAPVAVPLTVLHAFNCTKTNKPKIAKLFRIIFLILSRSQQRSQFDHTEERYLAFECIETLLDYIYKSQVSGT